MKYYQFENAMAREHLTPGEILQFDAKGSRQVSVNLSASEPVEVWIGQAPDLSDGVFLLREAGFFNIAFRVVGTSFMQVRAHPDAVISIGGGVADQRVAPSAQPPYTRIEPRPAASEFERMRVLMEHNERRREGILRREIAALRQAADRLAAPPAPPQAVPPVASGDGSEVVQ